MNVTRAQQDEAARQELSERGVDHWVIAELDAGWDEHIRQQQRVARGERIIPIPDDPDCTGVTSVDDGITRHELTWCPIHEVLDPDVPETYGSGMDNTIA